MLAREHGSVLILTKGRVDDCNTRYAQGGIAAAIGAGDTPVLHMQDTLTAGAGLCDPDAVQVLTHEGPQRVANLIQWGVPFDTIHGEIALGREGAHSLPRILHAGGDATGQHIELAWPTEWPSRILRCWNTLWLLALLWSKARPGPSKL